MTAASSGLVARVFNSAVRAINLGCTGVMVDASSLPLDENIEHTRAVVGMARGCGIPVEGELGYVPGVEGEDAERFPGQLTLCGFRSRSRRRPGACSGAGDRSWVPGCAGRDDEPC